LLDAQRAHASQSQIPDVKVVPPPILPEDGERSRIAAAKTDWGSAASRRGSGVLVPAGRALVVVPVPSKGVQNGPGSTLGLGGQASRNHPVGLSRSGLWLARDDRTPFVSARDDVRVERNFAQEGHAKLLAHSRPAAAPEDVGFLAAVRARERAHVLHDA